MYPAQNIRSIVICCRNIYPAIPVSTTMKIILTSIFVNDQERALEFYTKTLGFVKKSDVSAEGYRWLTVVAPVDLDGTVLLLVP